jgi:uncharacterized protein
MQPSRFTVRVPLADRDEVFLMNTLTDAQLVVSSDVVELLDRLAAGRVDPAALSGEEREAVATLAAHGFIVDDREAEWRALERYFASVREDTSQLRVTVLTTLQCNFACDYCYQGDAEDHGKLAEKMSLETAARVVAWVEAKLDEVRPERFSLTFFGGEPLLNQPVMFYLAERLWHATQARGVTMTTSLITNGLLLTPEVVDRLSRWGLTGVKVTLDGDRETHDRMRPLRGGQGTFDKIVANLRKLAGRVPISIGGNFDVETADRYPALLDFLREQEFADSIVKVSFKPTIRPSAPAKPAARGVIPLVAVGADNRPLGGTCMTTAGSGSAGTRGGSVCDRCHFADEKMAWLREETKRRGFPTLDGVHMGPCEIHRKHAYTIGPDGSLYACPGFTGEPTQAIGHIAGRATAWQARAAERFERLAAWQACTDCAFVPVCAGGCTTAAHVELGDMNRPNCHKPSFEAGVLALAAEAAARAEAVPVA